MWDWSKGRCSGVARYAVQCKNRTNNAHGLCHLHVHQASWINDLRRG